MLLQLHFILEREPLIHIYKIIIKNSKVIKTFITAKLKKYKHILKRIIIKITEKKERNVKY